MKQFLFALSFVAALGFSAVSFAEDQTTTTTTPSNGASVVDQQMQMMAQKMGDQQKCRFGTKLMTMGIRISKMGITMQATKSGNSDQATKLVELGKQMFSVGHDLKGDMQCSMGKKGMMMQQQQQQNQQPQQSSSQN